MLCAPGRDKRGRKDPNRAGAVCDHTVRASQHRRHRRSRRMQDALDQVSKFCAKGTAPHPPTLQPHRPARAPPRRCAVPHAKRRPGRAPSQSWRRMRRASTTTRRRGRPRAPSESKTSPHALPKSERPHQRPRCAPTCSTSSLDPATRSHASHAPSPRIAARAWSTTCASAAATRSSSMNAV
jgi:hypothetical protein